MTFAEDLKDRYPDTATVFECLAGEERDIGIVSLRCTKRASASICCRYGARTSEVS